MTVENGYCTFAELQDFFHGAPLTSIMSQTKFEALIDRFGLKCERIAGMAWRAKTETDELQTMRGSTQNSAYFRLYEVHFTFPHLRSMTTLSVFNGSEYEDWISTRTEGRASDYFIDYKHNIVYMKAFRWLYHGLDIKGTYIHGLTEVDTDIWELNLRYVAKHIMSMPKFMATIPEQKSGKQKTAQDENNERIRELESQWGNPFGVISEGF